MPARPVMPRWVRIAGWASLLLPLPSVAWRIAMMTGVDLGLGMADFYRGSMETTLYATGLEVVQVIVALLCFGLIRPWSETVPAWVPGIAGRGIPRIVPGGLGAIGATGLLVIIGSVLLRFAGVWLGVSQGWTPDEGMSAIERTILLACYIPFFAWPLAVATTVIGFWVRTAPARDRVMAQSRRGGV